MIKIDSYLIVFALMLLIFTAYSLKEYKALVIVVGVLAVMLFIEQYKDDSRIKDLIDRYF